MKIFLTVFMAFLFLVVACEEEKVGSSDYLAPQYSESKEKGIREYNLDVEKGEASNRSACDTIALQEYVLDNYPSGDYLVEYDRTSTYNIPRSAVVYHKGPKDTTYIFAVIAKSKPGERFIEKKNVIGFESSFINLDSTKLGTAFFYLTLFACNPITGLERVWEAEVPIHGGFNAMTFKTWKAKKISYIELNYEAGIISGHRNYNYFFVDGIRKQPHLMETYVGIVHKRTLTDINNDKYPDYWEFRFDEARDYIKIRDSIPFYWDPKRALYLSKVNSRWFRYY
ncbi:MAG: hypothetical protein KKA84_09405 [Bacteroidetes bacterium]|nr:hypothetical protein [Bacteroidota bacterium]